MPASYRCGSGRQYLRRAHERAGRIKVKVARVRQRQIDCDYGPVSRAVFTQLVRFVGAM